MNYKEFIALMAFATYRNMMHMSVTKVVAEFDATIELEMQESFIYAKEEAIDGILVTAQRNIIHHLQDYGRYTEAIMSFYDRW